MTRYHQSEGREKPLKWYQALDSARSRMAAGAFLVEGERAVSQIAERGKGEILEILALPGMAHKYRSLPLRILNRKQFSDISGTITPQGVMAVVRLPQHTYSEQPPPLSGNRVLLLEDIQDPGNVGTLIRTASAFDFCGVILSDKCADPFSPKVVQSSAGALLSVWIRRTGKYLELVKKLLHNGYTLVAADLGGDDEPSCMSQYENMLLALGNEASGLGDPLLELAQRRVRVNINREKAESLNVAACGAILMYLSSAGAPGNPV